MASLIQKEPFLFKYASLRTSGEEIGGYYDEHTQMWMIESGSHIVAVIEGDEKLAEISTKTETITEADDQKISNFSEVSTKTLTQTEKDDQVQSMSSFAEIVTTTKIVTEADDVSVIMNNMFL